MDWPKSKQEVYLRLPPALRQGIILGVSAYHRALRYGRLYDRTLALAQAAEAWSESETRQYQQSQLLQLLMEAIDHTAYYREALSGLSRTDLEAVATNLDLSRLPLLEKAVLKARTSDFLNSARRPVARTSTSGSTGAPMTVRYDRASIEIRQAFIHHHRRWLGLAPRSRSLRLSGREIVPIHRSRPPYWISNPWENQLLVSTYHLRPDAFPAIMKRVAAFAPEVIDGYPTAIAQLAQYIVRAGISLPSVKGVITTAETLDPQLRSSIQEGLPVPVLDYYSASEGVPFIQQCLLGTYHLRIDSGIFEILDQVGRPAAPGEMGELVVTSFNQWQMPLIRYRTGDLAIASPVGVSSCTCGRSLPQIGGVVGRVEDAIQTPDGRRIGMFSYRTLKHVPGMREAQIIQETPTDFRIRVVYDGTRSHAAVAGDALRIFSRVLGYSPSLTFEEVASIERGPNGKFRSTIGLSTTRRLGQ